jgi:hypothetical protein
LIQNYQQKQFPVSLNQQLLIEVPVPPVIRLIGALPQITNPPQSPAAFVVKPLIITGLAAVPLTFNLPPWAIAM